MTNRVQAEHSSSSSSSAVSKDVGSNEFSLRCFSNKFYRVVTIRPLYKLVCE